MTDKKAESHTLIDDVARLRDELQLQIELGKMEARDEWHDLEEKWQAFSEKAGLEETADDLGSAFSLLGEELKAGYERLKKAL